MFLPPSPTSKFNPLQPSTIPSLSNLKLPRLSLTLRYVSSFLFNTFSFINHFFLSKKHFNASLVFIDDVNNNWIGLYSTVLSTRRPTTGSGSGTSPTATVGGPTTHFTSFSVLVGEYNTDSTNSGGDGGDGNLDIILPAVLVPVVVGGMVFVAVVVAVSVALFSWWKWQVVHGSIQASESAVGL